VKKRILVVEDDQALARVLTDNLTYSGFDVEAVDGGDAVLAAARAFGPDLVLLDVMLPGTNGFDLCGLIRAGGRTPIIMLTARDQKADILRGLEAGADDYITKPVVPKELAARIRALLRRVHLQGSSSAPRATRLGDVELRREQGIVLKSGREVGLTKTEFRLLCEFADHAGAVLSRDQLLERVWGYEYLGDSRLVDAHVRRLRVKIEDHPDDPRLIVTVRGLGYRLIAG
jgi:two-component system, OmpR family, response regulator MtrA